MPGSPPQTQRRPTLRVLLLEDSAADARRLLEWLAAPGPVEFVVTHTTSVSASLGNLERADYDVMLADLCVDDSRGLATFLSLHAASPATPIVVQSALEGTAVAVEAVARGAQDYLVKRGMTGDLLRRALVYAVERARVERELRESRERYQLALAGSLDGMWDWNVRTGEVFHSERFLSMLGFSPGEVGGELEDWLALVHPDERDELLQAVADHFAGRTPALELEHRMVARDGSVRWMRTRGLAVRAEDGEPVRMAGSLSDVTARRAAEAALRHEATHDALTGLPNRALFRERLEAAVAAAGTGPGAALLFLDLDRFKLVNDGFGHQAGDRLLVAVADRLRASARGGDLVARLGGDEFALLLDGGGAPGVVEWVADRVHRAMAAPFGLGGTEVYATFSIGVVRLPSSPPSAQDVLRQADAAMYRAKRSGGSCTATYVDVGAGESPLRLHLEAVLRQALDQDRVEVAYQPIVALSDRRLVGFEALARLRLPDGTEVPPSEFIPIAEETGLIQSLGAQVLYAACVELEALNRLLPAAEALSISVNVSPRQLLHPGFPDAALASVAESGLDPRRVIMELTESAVLDNVATAGTVFGRLRAAGIRIDLDDFGTGYCSLGYLRRLSVDRIKVDRSFIAAVPSGAQDDAILGAIVSLARALRVEVVAEGVESEVQRQHLLGLGCRWGQGFLFSRPVRGDQLPALARAVRGARRWPALPGAATADGPRGAATG
jgi:diguanylate cyclase (GGDEF)-like protein/PAS domain S-box-containing protein